MTAEQKVKSKYPEAVCEHVVGVPARFVIYAERDTSTAARLGQARGRRSWAWADAARRLKQEPRP